MAENNNIFNRPFGLNVTLPKRTVEQIKTTAEKTVNIFSPINEYLEESNRVFSGDVAAEINKYNEISSRITTLMDSGAPKPIFNLTV